MQDNPFEHLLNLTGKKRHKNVDDVAESQGKILYKDFNMQRELDIARQVREIAVDKHVIPRDFKVDDGDMPTAKNFYQWVTDTDFGMYMDERPFMEQLIWGVTVFNEFCYRCSDLEWLFHNHKVNDTYRTFEKHVALTEHGVCPHCGLRRSTVFNKKGWLYNELAVCAGQRCVVPSTVVLTSEGLAHIGDVLAGTPDGWSERKLKIHNGSYVENVTNVFKSTPEPIIKLTLENGFSIEGTKDHPVSTSSGFVTLGDMAVGLNVAVVYGTRLFGKVSSAQFSRSPSAALMRADEALTLSYLQHLFKTNFTILPSTRDVQVVSAMLTNAGYPHTIDVSIRFTDEQHARLMRGEPYVGTVWQPVKSLEYTNTSETYDFELPAKHTFVTNGILSHNSGKSHTVASYLSTYLMHRMLKFGKPAQYYNLSHMTKLHGTFAALTYTQAKDTLYDPFFNAVRNSNWFSEYHSMLKHYENKYSERLFKFGDSYVDYMVRGLCLYPMGPDKRIMRGRTRWLISIDEIAYFDAEKESAKVKVNAFEIYDALVNSLGTVRVATESLLRRGVDDLFSGYAFNVSSPTSLNDMIHVLLRRSEQVTSIYGIKRPTWDVNPEWPRDGQFIRNAYTTDPVSAEKNYGANPPAISNPFNTNHDAIKDCQGTFKNKVQVRTEYANHRVQGQGYAYPIIKCANEEKPTMMALDAGEVNNSFAFAVGYMEGNEVIVKALGEVIPLPGFRVNFSKVYDALLDVMTNLNTHVLLADRWNSAKLLDDATRDSGKPTFLAERYSLKYVDMHAVQTLILQGLLVLPESEIPVSQLLDAQDHDYRAFYKGKPVAHCFKQMFTVRDGVKTVLKGDGYTDDLFRAVSLLSYGLTTQKYQEVLAMAANRAVPRPDAIAKSRLYSGGGIYLGTSGGGGRTMINGAPLCVVRNGR